MSVDCTLYISDSMETKKRKFAETIDLQIVLKNYDLQKNKRFSGNMKLTKKYDAFLASESLIKQIPRLLGPEHVEPNPKSIKSDDFAIVELIPSKHVLVGERMVERKMNRFGTMPISRVETSIIKPISEQNKLKFIDTSSNSGQALEELQEMNKRSVEIEYDSMLAKYDKFREDARKYGEADDNFVKSVFGKDDNGSRVKHIVEVSKVLVSMPVGRIETSIIKPLDENEVILQFMFYCFRRSREQMYTTRLTLVSRNYPY